MIFLAARTDLCYLLYHLGYYDERALRRALAKLGKELDTTRLLFPLILLALLLLPATVGCSLVG
jgi:hypothetical protein